MTDIHCVHYGHDKNCRICRLEGTGDAGAWRWANEIYSKHGSARVCCCPDDYVQGIYEGLKAAIASIKSDMVDNK